MPDVAYRGGKELAATTGLDWANGVYRVLLLETRSTTAGLDEDPDLQFLSQLLGVAGVAEMVATNYARQTLGTKTVTYDATNNRILVDAADTVFPNLGVADGSDGTARAVVLYRRIGADDTTPADDPLIGLYDVADTITNGANLSVVWSANGLVAVS